METRYLYSLQWFNNLITGVNFSEEQLVKMLSNIPQKEMEAWIREIHLVFAGTMLEDEVKQIKTFYELARFYYNNPIEE